MSRPSRLYPALLVPIVLAVLPVPLRAQEARDTARVAPVVVTATRTPLRADRVPASTTVISGEELRARGVVHLTDALRGVPGLTVVQSGSYGAPTTLFVRGGQGNYTKVLIDGVPANEPGGAFDFGTLTLDDVERVEIVRGPASVVWGSDAVSAVVHVITRRGARDSAGATLRGGSFGSVDAAASAEGGRRAWRGAATAAHHRSRGTFDLNSDYRNSLAGGSATWSGKSVTARLNGRYASTRAHFPTDFTGAPVDPNSFRIEERATTSGAIARTFAGIEASLLAGQSLVNASSINPADAPAGTFDRFDTRTRRQTLELRADVPIAAALRLSLGTVGEWQRRASASTYRTVAPGAPDDVSRTEGNAARRSHGAYGELVATSGGTTATMGGRADRSDTYGSFATYRIALSQALPTATRIRGSIGTGYREPSFDESLPSAFSTGNPDLEPERSASWEVGIEQDVAQGRVSLGATWFSQRFEDMIDYFAESYPGRYENVARAHARGAELEARITPGQGWVLDGSLTLVRTRVETAGFGGSFADGRALLRRPERTATAGIGRSGRRGSIDLRLAYVGARPDVRYLYDAPYSSEETLPAYTRVDLSGEYPFPVRVSRPFRQLALTLRVENALGASYETAAGYRAPGRAVLAGVRAGF